MSARRATKKPGRGEGRRGTPSQEQVRAWISHVFQPLVPALREEVDRLKKRSLSWEHRTRSLERIHLVRAHVYADADALLDQLIRYRPEVGELEARHDRSLQCVVEEADRAQRSLEADAAFERAVEAADKSWRDSAGPRGTDWSVGDDARGKVSIAASLVVNGIGPNAVPHGYSFKEFWAAHGAALSEFAVRPPHADFLAKLREGRQTFLKAAERLLESLDQLRKHYSDEHRLPSAIVDVG